MNFNLNKFDDSVQIGNVNIIQSAPNTLTQRIGEEDGFTRLNSISTTTATSQEKILENVEENVKLNKKLFNNHPDFQKVKPHDKAIAIVGGAPSLEFTKLELKYFKGKVLAAGSSHDFLIKNVRVPDYCAVCDPDKIVNNYFTQIGNNVEYLLASCCDPEVFKHLKDENIYMWHCYGDVLYKWFKENHPGAHLIGGGCTIGLRAINIAILMGYTNIHLFGMDSCIRKDKHHAYDFVDPVEEQAGLGNIYTIKIGKNGQKSYKVAGYQLAQAEHFREFLTVYHNMVTFTIHGDGLLKDIYEDFLQHNRKAIA